MALLMSYALGLERPASCINGEQGCPSDALTESGFLQYPVTYYPAEDIAALRESPFIAAVELPDSLPPCE